MVWLFLKISLSDCIPTFQLKIQLPSQNKILSIISVSLKIDEAFRTCADRLKEIDRLVMVDNFTKIDDNKVFTV